MDREISNRSNHKLHIVGAVGLPPDYGGWETLTSNLVKDLNQEFDITVYCSSRHYKSRTDSYHSAKLIYIPLRANGWQSPLYDAISMFCAIYKKADTILVLGVSGCIFIPIIKLLTKAKIIVNVDGIEWKRKKWGYFSKYFLRISEFFAAKYSTELVGDNIEIVRYLKREYGKQSSFIAFGGSSRDGLDENLLKTLRNEKFALNISRIEPENNIHVILEACQRTSTHIYIFGRWKANNYSKSLYKEFSQNEFCHLHEHVSSQEILNSFRKKAFLYIHGHSVGGTNPSLVEAMSWGIPIVAFDVIFNKESTFNKAIYFDSANNLADILTSLSKFDLEKISSDMLKLHDKNYDWKIISGKYSDLFKKHN